MKLHHLRDVVAIAEHGSLRSAARHLKLAQPAVTRSLGDLERELGAALFERRARGMVMTPIGTAFVNRAKTILADVRRARDEVGQLKNDEGGSVTVGLSIAPHMSILPHVLTPFRARFPSAHLSIVEGFYPTIESDLRSGGIDFYVGPSPRTIVPPDLVELELFENSRIVICRKGHPLHSAKSLRELAGADWATTSITTPAAGELNTLFDSLALPPPRITLRSQSALTLMICLAHSDLLAMVPRQWMEFQPIADVLSKINIIERLSAPSIVFIQRTGVPLTPAALFLAESIQRVARASA